MWSPSLASERKHVPQAAHVKGRRGGGSKEGEREGRGFGWEGEGFKGGRGVANASSRRHGIDVRVRGVGMRVGGEEIVV